jgi:cytochrome P450
MRSLSGRRLSRRADRRPPGGGDVLDGPERADRRFLLDRAARLGPIYSGTAWGQPYVHIHGLARCRRFATEYADSLVPVTQDVQGIVPTGPLRSMTGETHLAYRRAVLRAVRVQDPASLGPELEAIVDGVLAPLAADPTAATGPDASHRFLTAMSELATAMLVRALLGATPGTPAYDRIRAGFAELGPFGLVWNLGPRQAAAYERLTRDLGDELDRLHRGEGRLDPHCFLVSLDAQGAMDPTLLANAVFMTEMARADIAIFLRWLTRYAGVHADELPAIAGDRRRAEAFVMEELRSDQSERLEREVIADIEFEGFSIPTGTTVRLCMWEAHHDEAAFADPFRFDPTRFVSGPPPQEVFAPFGLDHHQCPFGSLTFELGTAYLRRLAARFRPVLVVDGAPIRGPYHWEPARTMVVRFEEVTT